MSFWMILMIFCVIAFFHSRKNPKQWEEWGFKPSEWHRENLAGNGARKPADTTREIELEKEVQELRDRVKVLERIATDGRSARSLAEEIESLRDKD
jgi:hypothetical protein